MLMRMSLSKAEGDLNDMSIASENNPIDDQGSITQSATVPWIIERDNHKPDSLDIDFLTLLLENEFR